MIKNLSHLVIATENVEAQVQFFKQTFAISPHFANADFAEFVLPGKARVAFFRPEGKTKLYFTSTTERSGASYGVTVEDVDAVYAKALALKLNLSGEPKTHPWGEKSFLLIDPDGNRWEVTESPSPEGHLVNLP